jgi:hypothetical protein
MAVVNSNSFCIHTIENWEKGDPKICGAFSSGFLARRDDRVNYNLQMNCTQFPKENSSAQWAFSKEGESQM